MNRTLDLVITLTCDGTKHERVHNLEVVKIEMFLLIFFKESHHNEFMSNGFILKRNMSSLMMNINLRFVNKLMRII